MKAKVKNIAIAEILNPTFGTTKQYLEVLKVKMNNSVPIIQHIKVDKIENEAIVYFPIVGEKFFIAVYIDLNINPKIHFVEIEAGSLVYLSTELPLPISSYEINKQSFLYGKDVEQPDNLEDKIDKLLDYLKPHKRIIREISNTNSITFQIVYYGYSEQMWGLHLKKNTMKRIIELGASLDIDIYASGKKLL